MIEEPDDGRQVSPQPTALVDEDCPDACQSEAAICHVSPTTGSATVASNGLRPSRLKRQSQVVAWIQQRNLDTTIPNCLNPRHPRLNAQFLSGESFGGSKGKNPRKSFGNSSATCGCLLKRTVCAQRRNRPHHARASTSPLSLAGTPTGAPPPERQWPSAEATPRRPAQHRHRCHCRCHGGANR